RPGAGAAWAPRGAGRRAAGACVRRLAGPARHGWRRVVVTGGEPALQWDPPLAEALRSAGFRVHMETNGTRALAAPVDWLTVSPKPQFHEGRFQLVLQGGDECKLIVDDTVGDDALSRYETMDFRELFLQPCMDAEYERHLRRTLDLVARHPRWRLSLQLHKILGLP